MRQNNTCGNRNSEYLSIPYKGYLKPVFLFVCLTICFLNGYGQSHSLLDEKIANLKSRVLSQSDSTGISTFEKFQASETFSYDFFELAYQLAVIYKQAQEYNLHFEFLQIIIENKDKYPITHPWPRISSKAYYLLADHYRREGNFDLAIENYIISAGEYEAFFGRDNFNIPFIYRDIATLYRAKYQYEDAIIYYKQIINCLEEKGTYKEARFLQLISQCYIDLEEFEIAYRFINLALDIHKKGNFDNKKELAKVYNTIGTIHEAKSEWSQALSYYQTAKMIFFILEGKESLNVAFYNNSIGNVFLAKAEYDSAMSYYKESLIIREKYLPKEHIELIHSYYNVGYTYSKLGAIDSALIYCDKSILSNWGRAFDSLSSVSYSGKNPLSIKDLIVSLTDKSEYYFILFLKNENNISNIQNSFYNINLALEYSNSIKNEISNYFSDISWIVFEKRLLNLAVNIFHLYEETLDYHSNLSLLSSNIKKNRIHNKYFNNFSSLKHQSPLTNNELLNYSRLQLKQFLIDRGIFELNNQDYNQLPISTTPSLYEDKNRTNQIDSLSELIKSNISQNQKIMDYLVCDSMLIIHVISKKKIIKKVLFIPDLEEKVNIFCTDIKKLNNIEESSHTIFEYLIQPIVEYLNKDDELIIIPDEYLFRVPFEAIQIPDKNNATNFIINLFSVTYSFSIQNLLRANRQKLEDFQYMYTGWTPYSNKPNDFILKDFKDTLYIYEYLPEAYNEINTISQHFKQLGKEAQIFFGEEATLQKLLDTKNKSAILHIATHNIVEIENPLLSHLLLFFDDNSPDRFDNILFLPIVPYLGLKANMVILDGCETGNGKLIASEGLLSMAHAISSNDVSNIVFSLWNISDSIAKKFMTSFIYYYDQYQEMDNAMQKVKQEFINSSYNHPYFWSGIFCFKNYLCCTHPQIEE